VGSVVLAVAGTSLAWWDGYFNLGHAVLAFFGLLFWHTSVNVLNDYFDYRSGIDLHTEKTQFSGGSGVLPSRVLRARSVLVFGLALFLVAVPIWGYFVAVEGVLLVPLVVAAAVCVLLYTPVLTRLGLGELASAYGVGMFPILVFYFVQAGSLSAEAIVLALLAAILVAGLHLLNEFPDAEADRVGGRRTLPIVLGNTKASWVLLGILLVGYTWLVAWVSVGVMPKAALLGLLTFPLAMWAAAKSFGYRDAVAFSPVLWVGAGTYSLTLLLLAGGYIVDGT